MQDDPRTPQQRLQVGAGIQCETREGDPFYAEILKVVEPEQVRLRIVSPDNRDELQVGRVLMLAVSSMERRWLLSTRITERAEGEALDLALTWPAEAERVDRRADPRVDAHLPVHVRLPGARPSEAISTYVVNISARGLRLVFPGALAIGQPLALTLQLPWTTLDLQGHVAWLQRMHQDAREEHHVIGVALAVPEVTRFEIARFVAKQRAAAKSIFSRGPGL